MDGHSQKFVEKRGIHMLSIFFYSINANEYVTFERLISLIAIIKGDYISVIIVGEILLIDGEQIFVRTKNVINFLNGSIVMLRYLK